MTRLDAISAYAEKERTLKRIEKENMKAQLEALSKSINNKKERIKQLCNTANACLNADIHINNDTTTDLLPQYAYKLGCFAGSYVLSKAGSLLGFHIYPGCPVKTVGFNRFYVNNDKDTRAYMFETDGDKIQLRDTKSSDIISDDKVLLAAISNFLDKFDYFEEKFYEYVDNIVGYNKSED